jgi:ring-1,2-phenylacetyl-CoA epoxidase subunit PaaC
VIVEGLLRIGDTCLILSQRLAEWCGHGPVIEEDIALTNIALDLLGQARLWLSSAGNEDQLAFLRDAREFRNFLLVEQPNRDYADTTARQFYFDVWHYFFLHELRASNDERTAGIAEKALKEVTYHVERSSDWVIRLGDGTPESHERMQRAIDSLWTYTGEMFEMDEVDRAVGVDLQSVQERWLHKVTTTLQQATLTLPREQWMQSGGKRGMHTEKLGYLLAEMQFLQRAYPGAQW